MLIGHFGFEQKVAALDFGKIFRFRRVAGHNYKGSVAKFLLMLGQPIQSVDAVDHNIEKNDVRTVICEAFVKRFNIRKAQNLNFYADMLTN